MTIALSTASRFHVSLTYCAAKDADPVRVQHVARILKNDGAVLVGYTRSANVYYGGENFVLLYDVKLPPYEGDKIIFECSMTIYGYDLDTTCDLFNDRNAPNLDITDLQSSYRKMMSDKYADVKIQVGNRCFGAHKCILKFRAPTFFRLHQGKIAEGKVILHGIESHIFEIVLEYIYSMKTYEIQITNNCAEVYPVATMYDLKGLRELCSKEMAFEMRSGNVCDYYRLAESHNDEDLLKHCKIFMRDNLFSVQNESNFSMLLASRPQLAKELENASQK